MRVRIGLIFVAASMVAVPALSRPAAQLRLDRVVLVMRHGVRPPTKAQPMPARFTPERWPAWDVAPGWLTAHGAVAVERLGAEDRSRYVRAGLLAAKGCPTGIAILADSDQRTIATANAWAKGLAPGCTIASEHRPQDERDPLFSPLDGSTGRLDASAANAAVSAAVGRGGIAAVEARYQPLLRRLDHILCGASTACGVAREPSTIVPAEPGKRPKLGGALDLASTAAQILLLEYADGKPMRDVGFGRATTADVTALSAFHALEFRLVARPRPIAAANLSGLVPRIAAALTGDHGARVTLISGHDTQVASLGGLLDVHWTIPGFATDDPAPGGAIVIERLSDKAGHKFVRVSYRAQTLDGIRSLRGAPVVQPLPMPGCRDQNLCTLAEFNHLIEAGERS
jgi:4-phytase/acid phosphatase